MQVEPVSCEHLGCRVTLFLAMFIAMLKGFSGWVTEFGLHPGDGEGKGSPWKCLCWARPGPFTGGSGAEDLGSLGVATVVPDSGNSYVTAVCRLGSTLSRVSGRPSSYFVSTSCPEGICVPGGSCGIVSLQ
jgi:hypothetical protein